MIYFLVTTCLCNNSLKRKKQYINGINKLKQSIQNLNETYKIIIIENNGLRPTFLNLLGCELFYTNNNSLPTTNKGYKELQDIFDCIEHYNIQDADFIVKMTGRYILDDNSEFINIIKNINSTQYECVIKYGSYLKSVEYSTNDCITGLIGMLCKYIKQIRYPEGINSVEWDWAKATHNIDSAKICKLDTLGVNICPGSNFYFYI
jgi:hypothetical protein